MGKNFAIILTSIVDASIFNEEKLNFFNLLRYTEDIVIVMVSGYYPAVDLFVI